MSFFEAGFDKLAAFCFGALALHYDWKLGDGAVEVVTGGAALIGLVLQDRRNFQPERVRLSGQIRATLQRKYYDQLAETGGGAA